MSPEKRYRRCGAAHASGQLFLDPLAVANG